jgi:hypothetical protein
MKKLMYVVAAAASLLAGGAFAQATDPRFTGEQPGISHPEQGGYIYGNSGWTPEQTGSNNGTYYGNPAVSAALGSVLLNDGRVVNRHNYQSGSRFARTRRDRDGDGIPNRQDRYPDDPNRR